MSTILSSLIGSNIISGDPQPPNIIFYVSGNTEMIRIAKDGFWVRGVKLEQDETEARKLFDALMKFLGEVRK